MSDELLKTIASNKELAEFLGLTNEEVEAVREWLWVRQLEEAAKNHEWETFMSWAENPPKPELKKYALYTAMLYGAPKDVIDKLARETGLDKYLIEFNVDRILEEARREAYKLATDIVADAFDAASRGEVPDRLRDVMKAIRVNGVTLLEIAEANRVLREHSFWEKTRRIGSLLKTAYELLKQHKFKEALSYLSEASNLLSEIEKPEVVRALDVLLRVERAGVKAEDVMQSLKSVLAQLSVIAALGSGDYTYVEQMLEYAGLEELSDFIELVRRVDEGEASREDILKLVEMLGVRV